jgi:hypothetical protein
MNSETPNQVTKSNEKPERKKIPAWVWALTVLSVVISVGILIGAIIIFVQNGPNVTSKVISSILVNPSAERTDRLADKVTKVFKKKE